MAGLCEEVSGFSLVLLDQEVVVVEGKEGGCRAPPGPDFVAVSRQLVGVYSSASFGKLLRERSSGGTRLEQTVALLWASWISLPGRVAQNVAQLLDSRLAVAAVVCGWPPAPLCGGSWHGLIRSGPSVDGWPSAHDSPRPSSLAGVRGLP